jgi:hypothetical protein
MRTTLGCEFIVKIIADVSGLSKGQHPVRVCHYNVHLVYTCVCLFFLMLLLLSVHNNLKHTTSPVQNVCSLLLQSLSSCVFSFHVSCPHLYEL